MSDEIDDFLARLPAPDWAAIVADMRRAQREAEQAPPPPPSIIPYPEFPRFGVARWSCPRGCGWGYEEPTDPGPHRLILPLDDIDGMLSLNAEAARLSRQARVEKAISDHYAAEHTGGRP